MHKSSRRPDHAHRFINLLFDGRSSAALTNNIGAGSPNAAAMPLIRPELAGNTTLFPDGERLGRLQRLRALDRTARRLLNRLWIEIKVP